MTNNDEHKPTIDLEPASPLKTLVWRVRVWLRDRRGGRDTMRDEYVETTKARKGFRQVYRKADQFMTKFFPSIAQTISKDVALKRVKDSIHTMGYKIVDQDEQKPWGAYYRLASHQSERFIHEFFPGLSLEEAKLGRDDVELSPKFLLVAPGARLSWQYHHHRAERWRFLTAGAYHKSLTDEQVDRIDAKPDQTVQFEAGERHRLTSFDNNSWTLVAEIWQHTDPAHPSSEDDIIRIQDDYKRN